jgi:hypothetical protein
MNTLTWLLAGSTWLLGTLALGASAAAQAPLQPPGLGFTRDFEVVSGGQAPGGPVYALASYDDGSGPKLYAGGEFYDIYNHSPFISQNIVRWDGANWSNVGWGVDFVPPDIAGSYVASICGFDGPSGPNLFLSGRFNRYYSQSAGAWLQCNGLLRWDGTDYSIPQVAGGAGFWTLLVLDDGSGPALYGCSSQISRFDGTTWSDLPGLFQRPPPVYYGEVEFLVVHDDGSGPKLYAAGVFNAIWEDPGPATPANGFARFEAGHWVVLPSPADITGSSVQGLVSFDDGHGAVLYHAGGGHLWRMQGGAWQDALPPPAPWTHYIEGLAVHDDGNGANLLVWGPELLLPGLQPGEFARMARFDGQVWTQVGPTFTTNQGAAGRTSSAVFDFGEGPDLYLAGLPNGISGQQTVGIARYRGVYRDVAPVCGGDGSLRRCPCDTRGEIGHGCPNSSSSAGARLLGQGLPASDNLRFEANSLPASALCVLFQGNAYDYSASFAGDGLRCAAGTTFRLRTTSAQSGVVNIPGLGEPTLRALANAHGDPLSVGSVRYYQVWYRDANPSFCTSGGLFNATNGLRVVW